MGPRDCLTQSRRLGDWEVDTIIHEACEQVIASPTEHESCPTLPPKVECRIPQPVGDTAVNILHSLSALAQAMTCDGGNRPAPTSASQEASKRGPMPLISMQPKGGLQPGA
jgi:IS30 family transposase